MGVLFCAMRLVLVLLIVLVACGGCTSIGASSGAGGNEDGMGKNAGVNSQVVGSAEVSPSENTQNARNGPAHAIADTDDTGSANGVLIAKEANDGSEMIDGAQPQSGAPGPTKGGEVSGESVEVKPYVGPYTDIGCESLVVLSEFAAVCGVDLMDLSKTYRAGSKNCYVSVRHQQDRLSHASVHSVELDSADKAAGELERRLKVRMAGASDKTIDGARTYEYEEIGRHNIEFAKGPHIVTVSASTSLCPEDKLIEVARSIAPVFT